VVYHYYIIPVLLVDKSVQHNLGLSRSNSLRLTELVASDIIIIFVYLLRHRLPAG